MKSKLDKVNELYKKYYSDEGKAKRCLEYRNRMKDMVEKHGLDVTLAATGYTQKTFFFHMTMKRPTRISPDRIEIAQEILSQVG